MLLSLSTQVLLLLTELFASLLLAPTNNWRAYSQRRASAAASV